VNIYYSPQFEKEYKKLPLRIKLLAEAREDIFRQNPSDVRLKTHKLQGALSEFYAFSVNYQYRIIFHYEDKDIVFDNIGTHAVYK
jgi:proteic killer suppression protein